MGGYRAYHFELLNANSSYPSVTEIIAMLEQHSQLTLIYKSVKNTVKHLPDYEDEIHRVELPGEYGDAIHIRQPQANKILFSSDPLVGPYLSQALIHLLLELSIALGGVNFFIDLLSEDFIIRTHQDVSCVQMGHAGKSYHITLSSDSKYLYSASNKSCLMWELTSEKELKTFHVKTYMACIYRRH